MAIAETKKDKFKRKVLLVTGVFPPGIGGMQKYYYHLCRTTGHRMIVLAPAYGGDESFDRGQPYKVIRRRFLQQETIQISSWPRLLYHTLATIRTEKTDVTIYGYILIGLIGLILQLFFRSKYVVSVHGKDLLEFRRFWGIHWLCKTILRRADGVLANSRYTKRIVMDYGVDERKIQVVYPGVEAKFERGEKSKELLEEHDLIGKYVLLTVGRLVKRKGHDKVIEALPAIIEQVPQAVYVIVGDGPERHNLERIAEKYGVRDRVIFAGSVNDTERVQQYYHTADTFIMTSRLLEDKGDVEGFGIVYLEAASCGLPAVAGRTGGVAEAVIDHTTGLLVEPTSIKAIAAAVTRLHNDPVLRESLAQAGYRRVKSTFQYEQIVNKMDIFLESVCAGEAVPIGEESIVKL
ncbi:MAG: glycosyltransferase family 4 protein [Paenibacillaceae bacterium]